DIHVDGFGVWKGLKIESLSDNVTVFYGQNEAGKTTLMQFIRSMMFGFSADRREKYFPPVYGGLAGGEAEIVSNNGDYEIQRHVDPNRVNDIFGDLSVTDTTDGTVHGRAKLGNILSEIDESIFNNVFAIGLREIQELNALNSTDASDMLYKLTSGLDRVSLVDVMRDLKSRREAIWGGEQESESRLTELATRRNKLLREIEELLARSKRWSKIAAQTNEVSHELEEIDENLAELERESRLLEIAMQINDRWKSRFVLTEQINAFGKLPQLRDISVAELDTINTKIAAQIERRDQIQEQRRRIKHEAMELPINRRLWSQKARIDALTEHSPWVESLQRQVNRLKEEIDTIENTLLGEVDGLGTQLKIRTKDVRDLGNRGFATLKSAAKKLMEQQDRLKKYQQEIDKSEFDLGQQHDRLRANINDRGGDSLEDTNRYVNRIRRRIELDEKINKLQASRHDLERDIDDIVNEQVLPVGKLGIVGVVFIAGIVLAGFGLAPFFSSSAYNQTVQTTVELGVLMMIMGGVCGFVSMGLKYHWEKTASDELDDFRHQMDVLRHQLKRTMHEKEEIERLLPDSISQWELELKEAEAKLAQMEDLVPLENRYQNSQSIHEDLRRRYANQQREVDLATEQWQAALRTAGLPEALEPIQLKEISQRSQRIALSNVKLDQYKAELLDRNKELDTLRARIDGLFHDCGLEFEAGDILDRLQLLTSELNEQRTLVTARKELASKYKNLRTKLGKCKREYERLLGQKRRLLAVVGADTEEIYRQFEMKHNERRKLVEKRTNLTEQIAAALGNNFVEDDLEEYLEAYGYGGLEKRWESVQSKIEETKEYQTRLHQQRGEFLQEVKMLGEDSRLDEARLELNSIDAEIARVKKQWQVLSTSSQMLESIREKYESKRQPETLQEASSYLSRLTDGHYTRIWTRLVGEELLVDNKNDETITVDKLSRGTREAVYLSLRLALIGAYARRGAVLPMVMDDILVNFDSKRARAAAELLVEFSRNGYQLLMFTCHEHMRDLFHSLDVSVKVLPHHREVVENNAIPSEFKTSAREMPVIKKMEEPKRVPAVEKVAVRTYEDLELTADDYDPELEYELSAVETDQQRDQQLRHELIYMSPSQDSPIDISQDHDVWKPNRN
ncbi:MAG: AAA family ATPase, partial [Planctomycetota bacterium]